MCEIFINVNKIPTKLLMYGEILREDNNCNRLNDIILLIPGTIGIPDFYDEFLKTLQKETGYPVWAIGHAGHDVYSDKNAIPQLENNENLYGIQGQIEHKIAFIEKYVPKNARIHFVGHSIGSHIILKLMEIESISNRVEHCFYLFPAIEDLKSTRNGLLFQFLRLLIGLILCLTTVFSILPKRLQIFLLHIYLFLHGQADRSHIDTIITLLDPKVLEKIFFMLYDEMELVRDKNCEIIKKNKDKMRFYYGSSDGWVPIRYFNQLKRDIPTINAELCANNYQHHFVLHNSTSVGKMVASWFDKN